MIDANKIFKREEERKQDNIKKEVDKYQTVISAINKSLDEYANKGADDINNLTKLLSRAINIRESIAMDKNHDKGILKKLDDFIILINSKISEEMSNMMGMYIESGPEVKPISPEKADEYLGYMISHDEFLKNYDGKNKGIKKL